MKNFLLCVLFMWCVSLFAQEKSAEYSNLSTNIFGNFDKPVGLAVFPFIFQNNNSEIASKFYDRFSIILGKKSNFIVNYYSKLEALKEIWGIKNWDPQNKKLLDKLSTELDIKFIIFADLLQANGESFILKIVNTTSYEEIFSLEFRPSINSNAIDDAIKLFSENKIVKYIDALNKGTLIIETVPNYEFKVYLNDTLVGLTPYENLTMKEGYYRLLVSDPLNRYVSYEESFYYDPQKQNKIIKNIVLSPIIKNDEISKKKTTEKISYNSLIKSEKSSKKNNNEISTKSERESENRKTSKLLFLISLPTYSFKDDETSLSGSAGTGFGGIMEFDLTSGYIRWVLSFSYSQNKLDLEGAEFEEDYYYKFGMLNTGFKIRNTAMYILGHAGLLMAKFPNINIDYDDYFYGSKFKVESDWAFSLVFGGGLGIEIGAFDLSFRYYYSEPEYNFKNSFSDYYGNFEEKKKQKKIYSVGMVTIGIRF